MVHNIRRLEMQKGLTLFVFGDRQQGGSGYRKEAWEEFRREFKSTPNAWALGLGDYGDWLRPSLRAPLLSSIAKDDSARAALDDEIRRGHDKIIDDMEFLKGRIIGLHEGHHNWKFASGENTDQRLSSALKAPYLGWVASIRLALTYGKAGPKSSSDKAFIYTMISTHGNANGRKVHAALGYLEGNYASGFIADQYCMGHGCKNANEVPFKRNLVRRCGPAGMDIQIPRLLVVGGFSEGYTDGWQSDYVERAGFTPQPMGYGLIRFKTCDRKAEALAHGLTSSQRKSLQVEQLNRVLDL